jgi:hypothetical protein
MPENEHEYAYTYDQLMEPPRAPIDFDAEHDAKRAEQVSKVLLKREAKTAAPTAPPTADDKHEDLVRNSSDATRSALSGFARRLHNFADYCHAHRALAYGDERNAVEDRFKQLLAEALHIGTLADSQATDTLRGHLQQEVRRIDGAFERFAHIFDDEIRPVVERDNIQPLMVMRSGSIKTYYNGIHSTLGVPEGQAISTREGRSEEAIEQEAIVLNLKAAIECAHWVRTTHGTRLEAETRSDLRRLNSHVIAAYDAASEQKQGLAQLRVPRDKVRALTAELAALDKALSGRPELRGAYEVSDPLKKLAEVAR